MSAGGRVVTVIRLMRLAAGAETTPERGVVAEVAQGVVRTDGDTGCTYLVVPPNRELTRRSAERRTAPDIRVGDVVGWIAEPYGVLWVAEQAEHETSPASRPNA